MKTDKKGKTALDKWSSKTYSSICTCTVAEGNRWLHSKTVQKLGRWRFQFRVTFGIRMVQMDQKASSVDSCGHGVEEDFSLAPAAAQKACGRGRAEGWMWPEGCAHLAAVTVLLGRGQLMDYTPTSTPAWEPWGKRGLRGCEGGRLQSQAGLCERIPHEARALCWDWRVCLLLTIWGEKRHCLFFFHTGSNTVQTVTR